MVLEIKFFRNIKIVLQYRHSCKNGRDLVSKISFEAGVENGSYTVMMSQCQITGWMNETLRSFTCTKPCGPPTNYSEVIDWDWMNETIGSFTCTKPCGPPTNYSEVFDWDWSESDGTDIGITIQ
jgi:hypothetical protein